MHSILLLNLNLRGRYSLFYKHIFFGMNVLTGKICMKILSLAFTCFPIMESALFTV